MDHRTVSAQVQVHATFSASLPVPLFIVGVEILAGKVEPGMFVQIPLNDSVSVKVRILATATITNDFGVDLLGLSLNCKQAEEDREFIDCLRIGAETWDIIIDGED